MRSFHMTQVGLPETGAFFSGKRGRRSARPQARRLLAAMLGLSLWVGACSEPTPIEERPIRAHPPEWSDPSKPDWHGTRVAVDGPGTCESCHGADLHGDLVVPGCYDCHDGPSGHPEGWITLPEPFHGTTVQEEGPTACASCHGDDYRGGWSAVSCYTCHRHPAGWNAPPAPFHGTEVEQEGPMACASCHGDDYRGGWSGVSCYTCHGHPAGWIAPPEPFHGTEVEREGPMACASCHGDHYRGGWSGVSCYTCHDGPGGHPTGWFSRPEPFHGAVVVTEGDADCRRCHGDDLLGGTSGVSCSACHPY